MLYSFIPKSDLMKTRTSIVLLLFVTFLSSAFTTSDAVLNKNAAQSAQEIDNVFRSFNVHRQGKGISLNWHVSSNNINGYIIQRSYDGEFFDDLDISISAVGRWHRANDNDVFPGYIHYRIIAILNDGTECMSPVQVVRIVDRK